MSQSHAQRRFGRVNWLGLYTLIRREVMRFLTVWMQTLLAPLVTSGLFLLIFTIAVGSRRGDVMGLPFTTFIAPGIMMMAVIQNAFANTTSSLMSAKVQGNIVDTLMPPLSAAELTAGYLAGGIARGVLVACTIIVALAFGLGVWPKFPMLALAFIFLGAGVMSGLGILAAIYAQKWDQMAAITNFLVTPLAFLSGTFYSITALPPVLQGFSQINPFFYLIDGVRFGMIGVSDTPVALSLSVSVGVFATVTVFAWWLFRIGYKLKP